MMLNEVVPRKSNPSVTYQLIDEDGIFGDNTAMALNSYKQNFATGVDTVTTDTTDTIKALVKWYELEGGVNVWLNKIVDRETLTGWDGYSGTNTGIDITNTGLYEYYANVVKPFTEAMMFSAENDKGSALDIGHSVL